MVGRKKPVHVCQTALAMRHQRNMLLNFLPRLFRSGLRVGHSLHQTRWIFAETESAERGWLSTDSAAPNNKVSRHQRYLGWLLHATSGTTRILQPDIGLLIDEASSWDGWVFLNVQGYKQGTTRALLVYHCCKKRCSNISCTKS